MTSRPPCPLLAADLRIPADCADDEREIMHHMTAAAPRLLTGRDPAAVGLLAGRDTAGRIVIAPLPLAQVWAMATRAGLARRERRGWFHALVIGERRGGIAYLAGPAEHQIRGQA